MKKENIKTKLAFEFSEIFIEIFFPMSDCIVARKEKNACFRKVCRNNWEARVCSCLR